MSGIALVLFGALCGCGVVEGLASGAVGVAVAKDWVPTVFDHVKSHSSGGDGDDSEAAATTAAEDAQVLTRINAMMSRLDLVAEFLGPCLAGLLLALCGPDGKLQGFFAIAAFNALTFLPQVRRHTRWHTC
jgi:hypothetical protein